MNLNPNSSESKLKLLLVEDEMGYAEALAVALRGTEFDVEQVGRLSEAVERLSKGGIELVVLDLGLPDSQGIETFRRVRTAADRVPIVVLSGITDESLALRIVQGGAQDYLLKAQTNFLLLIRSLRHAVQRHRAESALDESQAMFKGLFEASPDAIIVSDGAGRITRVNTQAEKMFGYTRDEMEGKAVEMLMPERFGGRHVEHRKGYIADPHARAMGTGLELYAKRKDGSEFPVDIVLGPLRTDGDISVLSVIRDITERKRAEAEQRFLAAIVESSEDAIIGRTVEGTIVSWNKSAERMLGYTADEAIGRNVSMLVSPNRPGEGEEIRQRLVKGERTDHFETVRVRKDGKPIPVALTVSPIENSEGVVTGASAILRDITERKRAEAALRESEERFRAIFEQAAVAIAQVGVDGRWLRVNQRFCDMVGYTIEELQGLTFQQISHPDTVEEDRDAARRMLANEMDTYSKEKRYVRKDGALVWVHITVSLVRDGAGNPQYFVTVVRDISQRKQLEAGILENEQRWRTLLENVRLVVVGLDSRGNVNYVNPFCLEVMGCDSKEVVGKHWFSTFLPQRLKQNVESVFLELLDKEFHSHFQNPILTKSGGERQIEWFNTRLRDAAGNVTGTLSIGQDITERVRAEEQLKLAIADLTKSHEDLKNTQLQLIQAEKMETIGVLAAGVAHNIKNPLGTAVLGVDYLSGSLKQDDPNAKTALKDIKQALVRADKVVRELLNYSTATKLKVKPQDISRIAQQSLTVLKHALLQNNVELTKELRHGLPSLQLDENKLEHVFVNLCMNAIEAMPNGGALRVRTSLGEGEDGTARVLAEIEDSGPGVPEDQLEKVFEPFFTTKGHRKGTGLGLTVAKQIVELHGGAIRVNNRPEGGLRVTMTFKP